MSRTALARQYRPRQFGEIAMQEHVSATLRSAVARKRVAHAYLFCGPRGVGKTTAARVLAMALNCPNRSDEGEPCGTCETCERIWAGRTSLDVVEIDAASNRGVDDARDLRERAMYAPTDEHHFKVYIIDEAHMLTREAWNALLKILEEPPARVIFVLATTEPQKIQQTAPAILSRCQRFDFRRIGISGIVARLKQVLANEGVVADDEALTALARRAEGGLRDALSLLDQVLSFTEGSIVFDDVREVLGLIDDEVYLEILCVLAERRAADVFRFVQSLLDRGHDLSEFCRGFADVLRSLLIAKLENGAAAEIRGDLQDAFARRADGFSAGDLLRMLNRLAEMDADGRFRKSTNPRVLIEAMLLGFAFMDRTVELESLLEALAPTASSGAGRLGAAPPDAAPKPPRQTSPTAAAVKREGKASSQDVSATPAESKANPADSLEVLRAAVQAATLPRLVAAVLRAESKIAAVDEERFVVAVPAGVAAQRLREERKLHEALEREIAKRLARPVRLVIQEQQEPSEIAPRITPERLRKEQIRRIAQERPVLGTAIEAWDLEIID